MKIWDVGVVLLLVVSSAECVWRVEPHLGAARLLCIIGLAVIAVARRSCPAVINGFITLVTVVVARFLVPLSVSGVGEWVLSTFGPISPQGLLVLTLSLAAAATMSADEMGTFRPSSAVAVGAIVTWLHPYGVTALRGELILGFTLLVLGPFAIGMAQRLQYLRKWPYAIVEPFILVGVAWLLILPLSMDLKVAKDLLLYYWLDFALPASGATTLVLLGNRLLVSIEELQRGR